MSILTMAISNPVMEPKMTPPSPITAKALMTATPHDKAMLLDVHDLLDKLFVRNVNQHRRSHWWKSLHAFRKQLGLLLAEMETSKKSEREGKIEARLRHWDDKFIHQWY
jgi:ribonuclease MRP protein subunit RMP1